MNGVLRARVALGLLLVAVGLLALVPAAQAAPPPNDNFAAAEDLGSALSISAIRSNVEATEESGEPFILFTAGHSVWFKWKAPSTEFVTVGTCKADIPTTVAVFTGTEVTSLTQVVSGNDDEGPHCPFQGREFTFRAIEETTYMIMVDGNGFSPGPVKPVSEGEFTLQIEATPPPANDDFLDAITLVDEEASEALGYRSSASGYNWGAGKEAGEPAHAGNVGGASVWYSWTAPASGAANIFACCGWPPLIGVYTGNSVNSLTPAEAAPGPALGARVAVTAGTTYEIAVDGEFDPGIGFARAGSFQITATMPLPTRLDNSPQPGATADVTPPTTKIAKRVLKRMPPIWILRFSSNEPGSTFECKLDKRPFARCGSSKTFKHAKPGRHTLKVRAVDPSGNIDPSPAIAHFAVPGSEKPHRHH